MKVKDLKKALEEMDGDREVLVALDRNGWDIEMLDSVDQPSTVMYYKHPVVLWPKFNPPRSRR